ncbi:hypothetical protein [Streptomyces sp. DH12]|uniref:hypothetical protein n=1 Tax=Streptomyces sp. DH12 TaxID=2857010 RepID=UPI001E3F6E27|nr:hypothetical protein [Streptomyces sp. DH12]
MRLTMTCGARRVDLRIAGDDVHTLAAAKRAAMALFAAPPDPPMPPAAPDPEPFGFALVADTDLAADPTTPDEDEECRA